jgi:hypothetical protein
MRPLIISSALALAAGCTQKSSTAPAPSAEPETKEQASRPGFKDLREFDVVSGKMTIKLRAGMTATLVAGGARVGSGETGVEWDTARHEDGVVELALKDSAGKVIDTERVVVLNRGAEVFFNNGSSGKVEVPLTGYEHQHLRYHWEMAEGVKKVVAILIWDEPGFDLELSLGRGTCPHHGTTAAEEHSATSPIIISHAAPEGQALPAGQWFAHVRLENPQSLLGKSTSFSIRAYSTK